MESPSVQPAYRNSYAPGARQNFDFCFKPKIARFPGQPLSLHKMQSLTFPLIGDDKFVIKRIPPVFLGTSPMGDTLKFEIGR
jgi:hypothetical protein